MEQLLRDLPRTEESHRLVNQWLDDIASDNNGSEVPLYQEREHNGSTASHGGPTRSDGGSTVSQDGHFDTESISSKRRKMDLPAALVSSKEGTFQTPSVMKVYLE